jgi:hypothetical protein
MDCHLGWYFTIGSSLRGGRGEKKNTKRATAHRRKLREKMQYILNISSFTTVYIHAEFRNERTAFAVMCFIFNLENNVSLLLIFRVNLV